MRRRVCQSFAARASRIAPSNASSPVKRGTGGRLRQSEVDDPRHRDREGAEEDLRGSDARAAFVPVQSMRGRLVGARGGRQHEANHPDENGAPRHGATVTTKRKTPKVALRDRELARLWTRGPLASRLPSSRCQSSSGPRTLLGVCLIRSGSRQSTSAKASRRRRPALILSMGSAFGHSTSSGSTSRENRSPSTSSGSTSRQKRFRQRLLARYRDKNDFADVFWLGIATKSAPIDVFWLDVATKSFPSTSSGSTSRQNRSASTSSGSTSRQNRFHRRLLARRREKIVSIDVFWLDVATKSFPSTSSGSTSRQNRFHRRLLARRRDKIVSIDVFWLDVATKSFPSTRSASGLHAELHRTRLRRESSCDPRFLGKTAPANAGFRRFLERGRPPRALSCAKARLATSSLRRAARPRKLGARRVPDRLQLDEALDPPR